MQPGIRAAGLEFASAASPPSRRPEATSQSNRARRFALPNLHDERTESSIQAFLDGPDVRRGRPAPRTSAVVPSAATNGNPADGNPAEGNAADGNAADGSGSGAAVLAHPAEAGAERRRVREGTEPPRRSTDLRTLPGRLEWNAALARESARASRYHHPASVAIVELRHKDAKVDVAAFMRSLVGPISRVLREESRSTDLVARVATARFQLLLPETTVAGAERQAQRLAARCRGYLERTGVPIAVRVSVAGTGSQDSLQDALSHALRAIEAA